MEKGEIFDSYEKISREMVRLRYKVEKLAVPMETKRAFYCHIDAVLHECRIVHENFTGGFWWDPHRVRSRKVIGA